MVIITLCFILFLARFGIIIRKEFDVVIHAEEGTDNKKFLGIVGNMSSRRNGH